MANLTHINRALLGVALSFFSVSAFSAESQNSLPLEFQWPAPTRENRPWTRWWWLGSAVDKTNLTRLLIEYRDAGIGGVEICPIYGAKGYEDRFIDFLSPKWMEMLAHTAAECKRLGLGLDLTTGTGWPFGGPNVTPEIASAKVLLKRFDVTGGEPFKAELPPGQLQCLMAYSDKNEQINVTDKVTDIESNGLLLPVSGAYMPSSKMSPRRKSNGQHPAVKATCWIHTRSKLSTNTSPGSIRHSQIIMAKSRVPGFTIRSNIMGRNGQLISSANLRLAVAMTCERKCPRSLAKVPKTLWPV
jgi:hypothetical protein